MNPIQRALANADKIIDANAALERLTRERTLGGVFVAEDEQGIIWERDRHGRWSKADLETCSWCTREVPDSSLTETDEGRLCGTCVRDYLGES
jgi:hypothetical protein